jgi:glycosyltransferase involved in cell wall biosynthesis
MRKIKVVHITNYDFGLKVQMLNNVLYFRDQGYDVSIVCNPGQWLKEDMYTPEGIFVKAIPFFSAITPLNDLKTLWQLYRYFRKERFDIVDTHTIKPGLLGGLAGRLSGIPIIIHTAHVFHIRETMSPLQRKLWVWIEKICFRSSDLVLLDNLEDIETAKRERFGPPDKFIYVGNGIDLARFTPSRFSQEDVTRIKGELGIEPGEAVVGMIGRLVKEKGAIEFFEAAKIIKEEGIKAKFVFVGPTQEKATAISPTSLIKELGLESKVLFLGTRWDIPELMSVMDVLVLPSHGIEGRARVLMEAAAMGKPAVATDTRGCREVVSDGQTGILVPIKDAKALADAIMDILSDEEKAQRMGRAARERAAMFDERLLFSKTDAEYRRLLRAKLPALDISSLKEIPA